MRKREYLIIALEVVLGVMFVINSAKAQEVERIDEKSYVVQQAVTKNLDDQEKNCKSLQMQIDDLIARHQQCQIEIDSVKAQPAPKEEALDQPAEVNP